MSERTEVEIPFIEQLRTMDWGHIEGDLHVPEVTERERFSEVYLEGRLREAVRSINLDEESRPWLDERRITQAVDALLRLPTHRLMEANQHVTDLLLRGTVVEGDPARHGGREQTVKFIDFDHPERNDFVAVNQFRVDRPGGREYVVPDIVLFVNGIPLVVVECKSPYVNDPVGAAVDDLLKYSNQRAWVEEDEGVERLFHANHLLVATSFDHAVAGAVGAGPEHFIAWKDTYPVLREEVAAELGVERLSAQQTLVAGMLRPTHLLDLLRNFTLFSQSGGRTAKIVARYQQYRAVNRAIERLLTGQTRREDGEFDRRGGIIWHTQGSGKSLTMVFLVRKMRTIPALRRFKVVIVTDRRDLEKQLGDTAVLTGETVRKAKNTSRLKKLLSQDSPDLVFAMIQKYREHDEEEARPARGARATGRVWRQAAEERDAYRPEDEEEGIPADAAEDFPQLNPSEDILVIVDEAHRSHASTLHANLAQALPNAARIGFTGTPIIMGAKRRTHEIFGPFIDEYTIRQAEADGVIVPILYEGRTTEAAVADERGLDTLFEDLFRDRSPAELEAIKRRYATTGHVLEAEQMIKAKADDMLRHYVDNVLPEGFKAQVVAYSRRAAVRYQAKLGEARGELVETLEGLDPALLDLPGEGREELGEEEKFLLRAHPHLEAIRSLQFAAVISPTKEDPDDWARWSDPALVESHIQRFKRDLPTDDPERGDWLAFLCVRTMLLTGFDAPVEQVMYLDRPIREHELLQAIARVNRTHEGKAHGLVVDYFGVAQHLREALAAYTEEDVRGALVSIRDELPKLRDRHERVLAVFHSRGVEEIRDIEACVQLLEDLKVRAEFTVKLKQFLETLNTVLPRPEALPYVPDAKTLGLIQQRARNRYRDEQLSLRTAGQKVRELIDRHIRAEGIVPAMRPVSILAPEFERQLALLGSDRAKASEMEHALRHHISKHLREDPVYYRRLSERLEQILERFEENWEAQIELFSQMRQELLRGRAEAEAGVDPVILPFRDLLKEAMDGGRADSEDRLTEMTEELVDLVRDRISMVGFWRSEHLQDRLRGDVVAFLDERDLVPFERLEPVADEVVALARANHVRLKR